MAQWEPGGWAHPKFRNSGRVTLSHRLSWNEVLAIPSAPSRPQCKPWKPSSLPPIHFCTMETLPKKTREMLLIVCHPIQFNRLAGNLLGGFFNTALLSCWAPNAVGAVLCTLGYLATPLVSWMLVPSPRWQPKMSPDITKCPGVGWGVSGEGDRAFQNHCPQLEASQLLN